MSYLIYPHFFLLLSINLPCLDLFIPYLKIKNMHRNKFEEHLKIAVLLTSIFFIVEIFGGLISGSLSLLGDAGHTFRDVIVLVISLSALNISKKLPSKRKTFGFHRVEIFAAFLV